MRVAVVAPVWFPVPPTGYGGIELVVSLLADGLVDAGHDVTLFASRRLAHQGRRSSRRWRSRPTRASSGTPGTTVTTRSSSYLQVERLRHRPRPRRHRRTDLRRDAARPPTRRAHAARTVDRPQPAALLARSRSTCTSSRSATRNAPPTSTCPYAGTVHNGIDLVGVPVPRGEGTTPRLHRARQSRQGTEGSDHDRAPRRAAAAHDPQARRAARARVLRARDRAAARLATSSCTRT